MVVNNQIRISEIPGVRASAFAQTISSFSIGCDPQPDPSECNRMAFPTSALNTTQRAIVEAVANTYQQDSSLPGITSISIIAASMGRAFRVVGGAQGFQTFGNLYSILAAMRSGNKGTTARALMQPLTDKNIEIQKRYREETIPSLKVRKRILHNQLEAAYKSNDGDRNLDQLSQWQKELENIELALKQPPALYAGSVTGAAFVELLGRNDEQIFIYSPEAGDVLKVALGRYTSDKSCDIDLWLSGFSVESFSEARTGRGNSYVEKPCVSSCLFVQPTLLEDLLGNEQAVDRGLAARFLYAVAPHRDIPFDDGLQRAIDPTIAQKWHHLVTRIVGRRDQNTLDIPCHPEAVEIFREFHNQAVAARNSYLRDIQGDIGRAREIAIRIALGQCVADAIDRGDQPTLISPDHAERGVALARFSYNQFVSILSPAREEKKHARLGKLLGLCDREGGTISIKKLRNSHGFDESELNALVAANPDKISRGEIPPGVAGGRKSTVIMRLRENK
jgi:hypothetical protein